MARLLLIEDMDGVRASLKMVLERAGHRVTEAVDGREGLSQFDANAFDLVITDILMPETDGVEVIMALKSKAPSIPVIAISGGGATVSSEQALLLAREKADAVLPKPFATQDVLDKVTDLLPSAGAAAAG